MAPLNQTTIAIKKLELMLLIALLTLTALPVKIASSAEDPSRAVLEQELADVENQIKILSAQLATSQTQKKQLTAKIQQLQINQAKLKAQIKSTTFLLDDLGKKIEVAKTNLNQTIARNNKLKKDLAVLIKLFNIQESNGVVVTLLKTDGLAAAFNEYQNYRQFSNSVLNLVNELKTNERILTQKKTQLADQKDDTKELLSVQTIQQAELLDSLKEQDTLLFKTKGEESLYKSELADQKKRAAEIRNRIYELFESTKTITFGQALDLATWAEKQTGVRAAFLLAVITQESNLGKNVGTCNRADDPPEKSWRVVMKPERDQEPFKTITSELGLDIDTTPVSCPMKDKNGEQLGWGGAMGPAQFIPSTWMGYRSKVAALTGKTTANPWDIRDAFAAAAIKLKDGGANGTEEGEWKAAMRYFSGSTNPRYRFYGDNVLSTAARYENDIKILNN